jgi:hypothetical protein
MHLLFFFLNIPLINITNLYEKSNFIHVQTNDNLVILTHKTDTLITLTTFLKKYEKGNGYLHWHYVWYKREVVKREIGKREYEKREKDEK